MINATNKWISILLEIVKVNVNVKVEKHGFKVYFR